MAQADIIIVDEKLLPQAVELYNSIFRPKREVDFFKRRFMGRYNALTLLARMDDKPVGFWVGFELKPGMFYHWLGGGAAGRAPARRRAATAGGAAGVGEGPRLRVRPLRVHEPPARVHPLRGRAGVRHRRHPVGFDARR